MVLSEKKRDKEEGGEVEATLLWLWPACNRGAKSVRLVVRGSFERVEQRRKMKSASPRAGCTTLY